MLMPRSFFIRFSRTGSTMRQSGFTLIEMIVTIVIIGILGVGISSFISRTTEGMIDTSERNKVSAIAWIVSEKLSRELRSALPNSIRTSNSDQCIEFISSIAATDYLTVPVSFSADNFEVAPFPNYDASQLNTAQDRVAVYSNAMSTAQLYDLSLNPRVISPQIQSITAGATAGALSITLSAPHQFSADSPNNRLYVVQDPIMYCFDNNGFLYRYSAYGFNASLGLQNQTVIANQVVSGSFTYTGVMLTRNAVVNIAYTISGNSNNDQAINQEVQIRNVP